MTESAAQGSEDHEHQILIFGSVPNAQRCLQSLLILLMIVYTVDDEILHDCWYFPITKAGTYYFNIKTFS